ncbi:MAG TPA: hypothetical protein VN222_01365 [Novosphingobium sp.]|nr:hypothetical protein [Novosphingobium sp.]
MANQSLFASLTTRVWSRADAVNQAGGVAYAFAPEAKLAQLAAMSEAAQAVSPAAGT